MRNFFSRCWSLRGEVLTLPNRIQKEQTARRAKFRSASSALRTAAVSEQQSVRSKERIGITNLQKVIATVTLGGSLTEKLEASARAGFSGVELVQKDLISFAGSARDAYRMATDLGLKITAYQPLRDFEGCPRGKFQERLDTAERMLEAMQELNAGILVLCSNESSEALADEEVMAEDLWRLAELAADYGIRVGYEALSWGYRVNTYGAAWRLIEMVSHPHLGLVVDSFHTCCLNDNCTALQSIPAGEIFLVQIADAPRMDIQVIEWSRRYRCFPGLGNFDLQNFLLPILRNGYQGPLSLEIFSDIYSALPPLTIAHQGFKSLETLDQILQQWESGEE